MRILVAAFCVSALAAVTGAFAAGDMDAVLGRALFERDWVPAPTSTDASDGLGPLFSARSCRGCHVGPSLAARFTDAPDGRIAGRGLVMRFADSEGRPDPLYGHLLQNQAVQGMQPEGRIVLTAPDDPDGALNVALTLDRGELDPATQQSVRIAPPLRGRALLDLIDASAVLALADPDDADGDGISGRARMIDVDGTELLGRYGWKAATTGLDEQIADAFASELGLSSARKPFPHGDCTERETDCLGAPTGESPRFENHEISAEMIKVVAAYIRALDVQPSSDDLEIDSSHSSTLILRCGSDPVGTASKDGPERAGNPELRASRPACGGRLSMREVGGSDLFVSTGCAACHAPQMPSIDGGSVAAYTDLLLHDMGENLDDGVGEPGAASAEWRTAPLLGMAATPGRRYLHDGRAPTLDLAIRAHAGEATDARSKYLALSDAERRKLVEFVGAL